MSSQQVTALILSALKITQQMLQKAEQQLWDDILTLEQQRQHIFQQVFPMNDNEVTEQIRAEISNIIEANQQLENICVQEKQDINIQLKQLSHNKKATLAYLAT